VEEKKEATKKISEFVVEEKEVEAMVRFMKL